jgi:regulator of sigma E protease
MGKKIFGFKKGETDYIICLLPLGGYVKLTGQDPREEVPPELVKSSFRTKPLYQRTAVVLAGPIANAILAIVVFFFLYLSGVQSPGAILERVLPSTSSYEAGLRSGDRVLEIQYADGSSRRMRDLTDLEKGVIHSNGQALTLKIERTDVLSKSTENLEAKIVPEVGEERDSTLGVIRSRFTLAGVERNDLAPVIRTSGLSVFQNAPPFLYISKIGVFKNETDVDAVEVSRFSDLPALWNHYYRLSGETQKDFYIEGRAVEIQDEKSGKPHAPKEGEEDLLKFSLPLYTIKCFCTFEKLNIQSAETTIISVSPGSPAEKMGLQPGDQVIALNDQPVKSFSWFKTQIQKMANNDGTLKIDWLRDGKPYSASVQPHQVETQDPLTEVKKNQFQVGAAFLALPAPPTFVNVQADGPVDALGLGFVKSYDLTRSMLSSFYDLATGNISPKTLGGPLLIAKISGESIKQGASAFFRMMAFISLNLFLLNLFPIPVLDGGHLVLFAIEAIRRKPLSIKAIEIWSSAGFFMLMGLIGVVFFNDLSRLGLFKIFTSQ